MIGLARVLNAWVVGHGEVIASDPQLDDADTKPRYITRADSPARSWRTPIAHEEWMEVVRQQHDFQVQEHVDAKLPSGTVRIVCPPLAYWMGHPSGRAIPFFFDSDQIEVRQPDQVTVRRMVELAPSLARRSVATTTHTLPHHREGGGALHCPALSGRGVVSSAMTALLRNRRSRSSSALRTGERGIH
jgi:hypothetical protein